MGQGLENLLLILGFFLLVLIITLIEVYVF